MGSGGMGFIHDTALGQGKFVSLGQSTSLSQGEAIALSLSIQITPFAHRKNL
ncbi:MAG: hypothetical protein WBB82_08965 [Limnothrix sp.]